MVLLIPDGASAKDVFGKIYGALGEFSNRARFMRAATQGIFDSNPRADGSYAIDLSPAQREVAILIDTAILLNKKVQLEEKNYRREVERYDPFDDGSSIRLHTAEARYKSAMSDAYSGLKESGYVPLDRMYRESYEDMMIAVGTTAAGFVPIEAAIVRGFSYGVNRYKAWRQSVATEARLRARGVGGLSGMTKAEIEALKKRREELNFYRDGGVDMPKVSWQRPVLNLQDLRFLQGTGTHVGDFRAGLAGASFDDIVRNVPKDASVRRIVPSKTGGSQLGVEFKWTDSKGIEHRLRLHDPDGKAPLGSNSANGWTARWQIGKRYYDMATGSVRHHQVHNVNSPNYDAAAANNTHIPIQTPDYWLLMLMKPSRR